MGTDELREMVRAVMREELDRCQASRGLRVLRIASVTEKTGLGRATIYEKERGGTFPSRFKVGSQKTSGWLESEIDDWILEQAKSREAIT